MKKNCFCVSVKKEKEKENFSNKYLILYMNGFLLQMARWSLKQWLILGSAIKNMALFSVMSHLKIVEIQWKCSASYHKIILFKLKQIYGIKTLSQNIYPNLTTCC